MLEDILKNIGSSKPIKKMSITVIKTKKPGDAKKIMDDILEKMTEKYSPSKEDEEDLKKNRKGEEYLDDYKNKINSLMGEAKGILSKIKK